MAQAAAKNVKPKGQAIRDSREDKILYAFAYTIMAIALVIVGYPCIYIISASFSNGNAIQTGEVLLWPVDVTLAGYEAVFKHKLIISGYINTILYTGIGTLLNVCVTALCAYPMSRHDMQWKGFYMFLFVFTMYFGGGLIPTYLQIRNLKLINTFWVMVIPGLMSTYNMIITRTNFQQIPREMLEAAQIDGCNDFQYFFRMVLPLSKAVLAVITLYYAVGHWNAYFNALIYLTDREKYPLQIILREILVSNQVNFSEVQGIDPEQIAAQNSLANQLKYALIIVSCGPILLAYPFVQKYFVKGVMIGSVKG